MWTISNGFISTLNIRKSNTTNCNQINKLILNLILKILSNDATNFLKPNPFLMIWYWRIDLNQGIPVMIERRLIDDHGAPLNPMIWTTLNVGADGGVGEWPDRKVRHGCSTRVFWRS